MGSQFCCSSNGRKKATEYTWISQLRGIHIFLIFFTCTKYKFLSFVITADPWTTRVWSAQLHSHTDFFSLGTYCGSTWSMVGWIQGLGTMDTEGQLQSYTWIFDYIEGWNPYSPHPPTFVQGSTVYYYKQLIYPLVKYFKLICFCQWVKMLNFSKQLMNYMLTNQIDIMR